MLLIGSILYFKYKVCLLCNVLNRKILTVQIFLPISPAQSIAVPIPAALPSAKYVTSDPIFHPIIGYRPEI